ncbi:MAG: hypothetical protein LAO56_17930 [Acidobacteriia bacterium]|nr:hypothetical protein [Terriglobia bacterium]
MSRKSLFILATLLISSLTFAQHRPTEGKSFVPAMSEAQNAAAGIAQKNMVANISPAATSNCSWTFTSPQTAANKYLQFCVTANGNITEFQSPAGVEYIRVGAYSEGYGICDSTSGVKYYDYADSGDSGNWLPPGPPTLTATSVKFARTTSDGVWTLTQTIAINKAAASANVTMALKNNTAVGRTASIIRFADVDVGGSFLNNFDGTVDSAWGYNRISGATSPDYGLLLQLNGPSSFSHEGFAINTSVGPDPCNSAAAWLGTLTGADGSVVYWQSLGNIAKNATKTVKEKYTAF